MNIEVLKKKIARYPDDALKTIIIDMSCKSEEITVNGVYTQNQSMFTQGTITQPTKMSRKRHDISNIRQLTEVIGKTNIESLEVITDKLLLLTLTAKSAHLLDSFKAIRFNFNIYNKYSHEVEYCLHPVVPRKAFIKATIKNIPSSIVQNDMESVIQAIEEKYPLLENITVKYIPSSGEPPDVGYHVLNAVAVDVESLCRVLQEEEDEEAWMRFPQAKRKCIKPFIGYSLDENKAITICGFSVSMKFSVTGPFVQSSEELPKEKIHAGTVVVLVPW